MFFSAGISGIIKIIQFIVTSVYFAMPIFQSRENALVYLFVISIVSYNLHT